jgi:hypothetical protein
MASVARKIEHCVNHNSGIQPRQELQHIYDKDGPVHAAVREWIKQIENIDYILPTTAFQRDYIPTQKSSYFILKLPAGIDVQQLEAAIDAIAERCAILRTVFVPYGDGFLQVVLQKPGPLFFTIPTEEEGNARNVCHRDSSAPVPFGELHFKAIFLPGNKPTTQNCNCLILRLSHAQYDAVSIGLLYEQLAAAYTGTAAPSHTELTEFFSWRARQNHQELVQPWAAILRGSAITYLPLLNQNALKPNTVLEGVITSSQSISSIHPIGNFTLATMHKAAWVLVLARQTQQRDIVFGQVTSGRDLDMEGIERLMGPCVRIVPVRVTLEADWTISDVLDAVQTQYVHTVGLNAADPEDIASEMTEWAQQSNIIRYGSVVQHQRVDIVPHFTIGGVALEVDTYVPDVVPTSIYSMSVWDEEKKCLNVSIAASAGVLDQEMSQSILEELCRVLRFLASDIQGSVLKGLGLAHLTD